MTEANEVRIYRIQSAYVYSLNEKLAKMNRKAAKLGCAPIKLVETGTDDVVDAETGMVTRYHLMTVEGQRPILAGWSFAAVLQYVPEAGMILRAVPGEAIPEKYRKAEPNCDHCRINRLRNTTYVVRSVETGEYKQVGSTCLRDFLGGSDPHDEAAYAEMLATLEEELGNTENLDRDDLGGGGSRFFLLDRFLAYVAMEIEEYGWTPRSKAEPGRTATADSALNRMFPFKARPEMPEEKHFQKAKDALAWAEENLQDKEDLNDYLHNMKVVTATNAIDWKMAGLAASLLSLVDREMNKGLGDNSEYVGTKGDKIQAVVTCLGVKTCDTQFGITYLFRFLTEEGNVLTTFTKSLDVEQGDKVEIRAKVKGHKEFNGKKQTETNYVKVLKKAGMA